MDDPIIFWRSGQELSLQNVEFLQTNKSKILSIVIKISDIPRD